jgi:bacterial/archaeal transporter family protein
MSWFVPALGYVLALGALGVTSKLALKTLTWEDLLPWTLLAYGVAVAVLMAFGQAGWKWQSGTGWAVASAILAVAALILLYVALGRGDASKVVPVTAAYPAATVVLSAVFLGENISLVRVLGLLMVIVGVVVLTLAR